MCECVREMVSLFNLSVCQFFLWTWGGQGLEREQRPVLEQELLALVPSTPSLTLVLFQGTNG